MVNNLLTPLRTSHLVHPSRNPAHSTVVEPPEGSFMKKQIKSVVIGVVALALAGAFTFWAIAQASETEFVPRSEYTTTTTTSPPPSIEPSLAPNGPGTGSCVKKLPDGSVVDCG